MIDHKLKVIQIHIPKTGGLTIRKHLFKKEPDRYMHIKPDNPRLKDYWEKYYKFTFVRNPFDKLLSGYLFTMQKQKEANSFNDYIKNNYKTFEDFVMSVNPKKLLNTQRFELQLNWVKGYNFDYIGRLENLQEDFYTICDNINHPRIELLRINNSRSHEKSYMSYYNKSMIERVTEIYKPDLKYFNYTFGGK